MADLEFHIRKAIKSGLNYLSLSPNIVNPDDGNWVAAYRHVENANCNYVSDDDPIEAIIKAVSQGEREVKALRRHFEEVEGPLKKTLDKIVKTNTTKVFREKAVKEQAVASRKRDMSDLI